MVSCVTEPNPFLDWHRPTPHFGSSLLFGLLGDLQNVFGRFFGHLLPFPVGFLPTGWGTKLRVGPGPSERLPAGRAHFQTGQGAVFALPGLLDLQAAILGTGDVPSADGTDFQIADGTSTLFAGFRLGPQIFKTLVLALASAQIAHGDQGWPYADSR